MLIYSWIGFVLFLVGFFMYAFELHKVDPYFGAICMVCPPAIMVFPFQNNVSWSNTKKPIYVMLLGIAVMVFF